MLVTQNTINAVTELIGECFTVNRKLDRIVSLLGAKFAYNQTSELCHQGLAHYFPKLADELGSRCLERYNIPVVYEATPPGNQNYESVIDAIKDIQKIIVDFQSMMMGCAKIAFENNDIHVYSELLDLMEDVNEVTEQSILLVDKIGLYGNHPVYDHDITTFWILGEDK